MKSLPQSSTTYTMRANKRIDSYPIQPRGRGCTGPVILFVGENMTKRHRITIIAATLVAISLGELYLLQHLFERRRSAVIRQLESDLRTERERTQSLFKMQSAISAAAEHRQKYLAVIPVITQSIMQTGLVV